MDGDLHTISAPPFGRLEADLMQTAYFLERFGYLRLDAETSRAKLYISLQKLAGSRHTARASGLLRLLRAKEAEIVTLDSFAEALRDRIIALRSRVPLGH